MAYELKLTIVLILYLNGPGVFIVVCSMGYRSSSIIVCNFVSNEICIVILYGYKQK